MRKTLSAAILTTALLLPASASASAWEAKTMRDPLSTREVERPLIIGKGWLELGLGVDYKLANSEWGPDGSVIWWDDAEAKDGVDTSWLYTTERLDVRYGVTRRAELYWSMPFHYLRLTNDRLGTDTSGWYIGDPRFGWKHEIFRTDAPLTSVITRVELKMPAGNETPGSYIAGPSTFRSFVVTTGTADLTLALEARRQFGIFGVQGSTAYVYRFSGLAQYLIETENNQFNARIKPGAQVRIAAAGMGQFGPVNLRVGGWFENHGPVRIGPTSDGIFPDNNLDVMTGSEGWSYGLDPALTLNATRNIDLVIGASVPLRGEDLMFFPIEDLHPTRGVTWTGNFEFRY